MSTVTSAWPGRLCRRRILRLGQGAGAAAVVIAVFVFAVPRFADYGSAWTVVKALSWSQIMLLVGATAFSVIAPSSQLVASLPGLTLGQAIFALGRLLTAARSPPAASAWWS